MKDLRDIADRVDSEVASETTARGKERETEFKKVEQLANFLNSDRTILKRYNARIEVHHFDHSIYLCQGGAAEIRFSESTGYRLSSYSNEIYSSRNDSWSGEDESLNLGSNIEEAAKKIVEVLSGKVFFPFSSQLANYAMYSEQQYKLQQPNWIFRGVVISVVLVILYFVVS